MKLKKTYVFGTLVQFYETEMLQEHLHSCVKMLDGIENAHTNVTFVFYVSADDRFEKIDYGYFKEKYDLKLKLFQDDLGVQNCIENIIHKFFLDSPYRDCLKVHTEFRYEHNYNGNFQNISYFRHYICDRFCTEFDYVCWGETDSLWPSQTLVLMEELDKAVAIKTPKFVANFAGRLNWDETWRQIAHPLFENIQALESMDWVLQNEASEKSYMTYERMEEINAQAGQNVQIQTLNTPKADGSCLIISSQLLLSGATVPRGIILCGEDEAFLQNSKRIMGNEFVQYNFKNILRVHNRRHPNKRTGILNESNPRGFCNAKDKGQWWGDLEKISKQNLENLFKQRTMYKENNVLADLS
jgi:hypothetical protein